MRRIPVSVVGACRVGELNVFVIFVSSFSAEKEKRGGKSVRFILCRTGAEEERTKKKGDDIIYKYICMIK